MFLSRIRRASLMGAALLLSAALVSQAGADSRPLYQDASQPVDKRVEDLLQRMTLQEKAALTAGGDFFSSCAIPRLGIPSLLMTDGPNGVRRGKTTAFPTGICLAASWDPVLARRYGQALGQEALGLGRDMLLGPCVNISRYPLGGRSFEGLGEDPWLTARLAVAYIQGVQSQGVAACVKHYAANNEEIDRMTVDAQVDERVLREIYLPAFEAAVKEAKVLSVMTAYNRLNGAYCSDNAWLDTQVLKKEWGFQGLVVSDWGGTHTGPDALRCGLDMEMPGPGLFLGARLLPELRAGGLPVASVDAAARRVLRVIFALGLMDHPLASGSAALHPDLARETAEEGIVLLQNRGGLLPLRPSVRCLAVIGPNADVARTGGGGSSKIDALYPVSPLDGLRKRLGGNVKILFAQGATDQLTPVPADQWRDLRAEYFANRDLEGPPALQRDEKALDYDWGGYGSPGPKLAHDDFSARWQGRFVPAQGGAYLIGLQGSDGLRLSVDNKLVVDDWRDHARRIRVVPMRFEAGRSYSLKVEYYQKTGSPSITLGWQKPGDLVAQAVRAARQADVAIVFVGLSERYESEGFDRKDFGLPAGQDALIQAVVAANPHTVVVVNSGSPVGMEPWIRSVPAVLQAWYPGVEGGAALARILTGDVDPSGKLPVSFPVELSDSPAFAHFPGKDGITRYAEGLLVGYRYYDTKRVAPRFPFGHGLSYTRFNYSHLALTPEGQGLRLDFDLRNAGARVGAEVAQVYVRPLRPSVERPFQELKGFQRVALKVGESRRVEITLKRRAFSYWDEGAQDWRADAGGYEIRVGSSSRDIRLRKVWELKP